MEVALARHAGVYRCARIVVFFACLQAINCLSGYLYNEFDLPFYAAGAIASIVGLVLEPALSLLVLSPSSKISNPRTLALFIIAVIITCTSVAMTWYLADQEEHENF
jgi:hypothetical protein